MSLIYHVCVLCVYFKCLDLKETHNFNRGLIPEPFKNTCNSRRCVPFGENTLKLLSLDWTKIANRLLTSCCSY